MIYVTDVSQYTFCPYSIYLKRVKKVQVPMPYMIFGSIYHRVTEQLEMRERILFDHFVEEDMGTEEIADILYRDTKKVVKNTVLRNKRRIKGNFLDLIDEINFLFHRRATHRASLLDEAMRRYGKKDIYDEVFPKTLTERSIVSRELNLCGRIDRIEKEGEEYHPVEIKTGRSERYIEKDILQLTGYALLMEEEFGSPVDKGFIEYVVLDTKREIEIDEKSKNTFIQVKDAVENVLTGFIPEKERRKKCEFCNFRKICWEDES